MCCWAFAAVPSGSTICGVPYSPFPGVPMAGKEDRRTVVVPNTQGLHARPADMLARTATGFQADVWFVKDGDRFDAKSILSIMTMGASQGTRIDIVARGDDAIEAVSAVAECFERGFDELKSSAEEPPMNEEGSDQAPPHPNTT